MDTPKLTRTHQDDPTKYTPWMDESTKPSRVGMYQILTVNRLQSHDYFARIQYAYWDGRRWGWRCASNYQAFLDRDLDGGVQALCWRGLINEEK